MLTIAQTIMAVGLLCSRHQHDQQYDPGFQDCPAIIQKLEAERLKQEQGDYSASAAGDRQILNRLLNELQGTADAR